jgi:hypothetical protein
MYGTDSCIIFFCGNRFIDIVLNFYLLTCRKYNNLETLSCQRVLGLRKWVGNSKRKVAAGRGGCASGVSWQRGRRKCTGQQISGCDRAPKSTLEFERFLAGHKGDREERDVTNNGWYAPSPAGTRLMVGKAGAKGKVEVGGRNHTLIERDGPRIWVTHNNSCSGGYVLCVSMVTVKHKTRDHRKVPCV